MSTCFEVRISDIYNNALELKHDSRYIDKTYIW